MVNTEEADHQLAGAINTITSGVDELFGVSLTEKDILSSIEDSKMRSKLGGTLT